MDIIVGQGRQGIAACLVAAGLLTASSLAADERVSLRPSLTATHVYDDNLFSTASAREADNIFRVSPALEVRYGRPSLELTGRYTFDAERYFSHSELDSVFARRQAAVTMRYAPATRLSVGASLSSFQTTTPQDLNAETALSAGRAQAGRYTVTPEVTYQLGSRTKTGGSYEFGWSTLAGGSSIRTGTTRLTISRNVTPVDEVVMEYQAHRIAFGGFATDTSHVLMAGWTRRFSNVLDATLRGGPRMTGGSVRPELSASLARRIKQGDLALEYARSESTSLGQTAVIDVERFTASLTARPGRDVELRIAPSATRDVARDGGLRTTVYALAFGAARPFTEWLSLSAGYHVMLQRGTVRLADSTVPHGVFLLSLVATMPR